LQSEQEREEEDPIREAQTYTSYFVSFVSSGPVWGPPSGGPGGPAEAGPYVTNG